MTFPITDMIVYIAADGSEKSFPTGLAAVVLVGIFIIVSVVSGIVSFKMKLKKMNNNSKNAAGDDKNES